MSFETFKLGTLLLSEGAISKPRLEGFLEFIDHFAKNGILYLELLRMSDGSQRTLFCAIRASIRASQVSAHWKWNGCPI